MAFETHNPRLMSSPRKYNLGDACTCWQLGDGIDEAISHRVLSIYRRLMRDDIADVRDIVPSYDAIAVYYDAASDNIERIEDLVESIIAACLEGAPQEEPQTTSFHKIPVRYGGPDLDRVAGLNGLKPERVIELHVAGIYTVAMIGFRPHFPYLIGLDARIETPRLDAPRARVPAGSVGIGGAQTGVYPTESPGGWNIIGSCDPALLERLRPGDRVEFQRA